MMLGRLGKKKLLDGFECVFQGLVSLNVWGLYGMGGSQDLVYEYFFKQYLLLGGLVLKYKIMYEKIVVVVKKYFLFRLMVKGDLDILFLVKVMSKDGMVDSLDYEWEIIYLICFLGGMFGFGGKIFESLEDVEIGKKFVEGCFWVYDVMFMGIMFEYVKIMFCKLVMDCKFNEMVWYEQLDYRVLYWVQEMERYYESKVVWKEQVEEIKKEQVLQKERVEKVKEEVVRWLVVKSNVNFDIGVGFDQKIEFKQLV